MMKKGDRLDRIRDLIRRIGDRTYQRRSWLGVGPEVWSPDEMYNEFFDDLMVPEFLASDQVTLEMPQRKGLEALVEMLEAVGKRYPDNIDAKLLLEDPEWERVRHFANGLAERL